MVFILLAISAMAIDLGMLYVARSEAQRAADGGALAGAKAFIDSGYMRGGADQATAEAWAQQEAIDVAAQNTVGGQAALVMPGDVTFDFSNPDNPRIQVMVQRTTAAGNPMPTLFARALGIMEGNVSAMAVAEAFRSTAGGPTVGTGCVKPWILPNCDPNHSSPENLNCPGNALFVDGPTIVNEGVYPSGVIGARITVKPGLPQEAPAPGQFYPIQIPPGGTPSICPECAKQPGGSEGPGGALYRNNISCCNTNQFVCGQQVSVDEQTGNLTGPTNQGVQCLIHQDKPNCTGNVNGCGQDYINGSDPLPDPFDWTGGDLNPNPLLRGKTIRSTDSLVTIPLYNGAPLTSGESGPINTIQIVGFLQLFIERVSNQGAGPTSNVQAHIISVSGCGSGGSGGPGPGGGSGGADGSGSGGGTVIIGPGGSPFPIRLIRPSS
jgi:hypothetical protein